MHCCLVTKLCPTLCNPMDYSPPGSSVHRISQARILEQVAISFSRVSSQPRDQIHVSCIDRWILYHWATWEAPYNRQSSSKNIAHMSILQVLIKEMATHSSTVAWRIPWIEEPGRLQSMGLKRVRLDWVINFHFPFFHPVSTWHIPYTTLIWHYSHLGYKRNHAWHYWQFQVLFKCNITHTWGKEINMDWALRICPRLHACVLSCFSHCPTLCDPMYSNLPAPLSMGFSMQEYRRGLPFPSQGDLPDPGIKPASHISCIGRWVLYHECNVGSPNK